MTAAGLFAMTRLFATKWAWAASPLLLTVGLLAFPALVRAQTAPLVVGTTSLPNTEVTATYAQSLTASGGTTPYTWAISTGALPDGLSLDAATGAISGSSTTVGTVTFTAEVTDADAETATQSLSITTNPVVGVGTSTLPYGQAGVAYEQTLAASGGVAPFSWSVLSGALPAGLALTGATGVIAGTPTVTGAADFVVQVTDGNAKTATASLSITVFPAVSITTTAVPDATLGVAYAQTLAATGGTTPYAWTITSGALPAGLTITAGGVIAGVPSTAGMSTFIVQVTDALGQTAATSLTIDAVAVPTLTIATVGLADAEVGVGYAQTLVASGGIAPYSWTIVGGSLPAGLTLTGTGGVIAGTPTTAGSGNFTVQVTDAAAQVTTRALTIAVLPADGGGEPTSDVLAACASASAAGSVSIQRLCALVQSDQLPPWAMFNIGQVIIRFVGQHQPEDFDARVAAACLLAAGADETTTLCDVFAAGDLPAWAQNAVGRIVLKLTGQPVGNAYGFDKGDWHKRYDGDAKHGKDTYKEKHKDVRLSAAGDARFGSINVQVKTKSSVKTNGNGNVFSFLQQVKSHR